MQATNQTEHNQNISNFNVLPSLAAENIKLNDNHVPIT
jgi:hypothetical protein